MVQLILRAIRDPDISVGGNADAHQLAHLACHREVGFFCNRTPVEIHEQYLPVEAGDPDFVESHGRAPADAVNAHAGEASDRGRESRPVGAKLGDAATDALVDAGLRAGHPVLAAPEVAFRIEHEPPIRVTSTTRETKTEGKVLRGVGEIWQEWCLATGAVLRLGVRLVKQRVEFLRVGPRSASDGTDCLQAGLRCPTADRGCRLQEALTPSVVALGVEGSKQTAKRVQIRERRGLGAVERIEKYLAPAAGLR